MKYANGIEIQIGDQVKIGHDDSGLVVGVLENRTFLPGYDSKDWAYLNAGILVNTKNAGLIHYPEQDEEIVLISRD